MQQELIELNEKAREEGKRYTKKRSIYSYLRSHLNERIFIGLVGPRGVGKTILLKQLLAETENAFYVSLDNSSVPSLYELARELESRGVRYLILDEIQFYPRFQEDLKKIFDVLAIMVIFSGSVALSLSQAAVDLSRRVRIVLCPPFTFREFITFEKGEIIPEFSFAHLFEEKKSREYYGKVLTYETLFESYLVGRSYPFTLGKSDYMSLFSTMLERIIANDLPKAGLIVPEEIRDIRNIVSFIGKSPAEDLNYTSLSRNLGITKYKAEKYVKLLEQSFVLTQVFPTGTNVLKEPKILLSLPFRLLYKSKDDCIGALREDFFVETLRFSGQEYFYLKSTRGGKTPDYLFADTIIEIGGTKKGISQFKNFKARKKIILTHPGIVDRVRRPLFFFGLVEWKSLQSA